MHIHNGTNSLYSEIEKIIKIIFTVNLSKQQDVGAISKNQSSARVFFGGRGREENQDDDFFLMMRETQPHVTI